MFLDERELLRGGIANEKDGGSGGTGKSNAGSGGRAASGPSGNIYALFQAAKGVPGAEVKNIIEPEVTYISVADGTRSPGDLEDRAARYIESQHRLLINADFRVFNDMTAGASDTRP